MALVCVHLSLRLHQLIQLELKLLIPLFVFSHRFSLCSLISILTVQPVLVLQFTPSTRIRGVYLNIWIALLEQTSTEISWRQQVSMVLTMQIVRRLEFNLLFYCRWSFLGH